jgi:PAS domain S-box-containing protein
MQDDPHTVDDLADLRKSQAALQSFFDTAPVYMGIGELDGDNLVVVAVNRMTAALFAHDPLTMPGQSSAELGTPSAIDAIWLAHIRASVATAAPVHFEYQDHRFAGAPWLSATVAGLGRGPTGRPQYSFVAEDITARKAAEARFQAITNLVPDLLWSNDALGAADWYNQRWLTYTGQTPAAALGLGWLDVIHPDDQTATMRNFQVAAEQGVPFQIEHRIRSTEGEYRWFLVRAEPLYDERGHIARWFGAATDIHEQRTALEALQKARGDLEVRVAERTSELQELSHTRQVLLQRLVTVQEDERNRLARELHDTLGQYLSAINFRLSLLQANAELTPSVRAEIDALRPVVQQLDRELDRLTLELRPPALDDLGLPDALRRYAEEWSRTSGIPVDVVDTGFSEERGQGLGQRFQEPVASAVFRIVQEALTNILKHAGAQTVNILVERRRTELRVAIEDDGRGFDPKSPAHRRSGRRRLGLVGMQERATLAGGSVEIESAPGHGATIFLRIPLSTPRA